MSRPKSGSKKAYVHMTNCITDLPEAQERILQDKIEKKIVTTKKKANIASSERETEFDKIGENINKKAIVKTNTESDLI